tara:strand:- start:577 stop:810 length:234 start_codon:yes stop_codon:yes gene_type:complete
MNITYNATTPPCGIFNPFDCATEEMTDEDRFLALVIIALACAVCVMCILIFVLSVLVYKLSLLWLHTAPVDVDEEDL